ncbi:MAG: nucleoside phosphorylase [Flavobacteriaceae bacterium]|nr:nucleoside phosphorylase [Flavobacteriaceae bacterium]
MPLLPSELILNEDQSIYHLNLHPEDIADTIITVGDPDRVAMVTSYFDSVEIKKGKREFVTHTGHYKGKRLTVISTGIGTDNIDIVLNELDALVNIDFKTRKVKEELRQLKLIRVGTSGALQPEIQVDSFLMSEYAIGFDNLLHFYDSSHLQHHEVQQAFLEYTKWSTAKSTPYVIKADDELLQLFASDQVLMGVTATKVGFYGPQGRKLRLELQDPDLNHKLSSFRYKDRMITNLEMETSGIYGLSRLLGHQAVSMNCILANRYNGTFSKDPEKAVKKLIEYVLEHLTVASFV